MRAWGSSLQCALLVRRSHLSKVKGLYRTTAPCQILFILPVSWIWIGRVLSIPILPFRPFLMAIKKSDLYSSLWAS